MANSAKTKKDTMNPLICFRINKDVLNRLEKYASANKDDSENPLVASTAARKLMVKALLDWEKHQERVKK